MTMMEMEIVYTRERILVKVLQMEIQIGILLDMITLVMTVQRRESE